LYRACKKYDEAIAYLNKLREKDSKDIVSIINLAFLYDYKVYLLNEELIAIKHTLSQTEGFDAKISAQKDKVIVFEEEIKNVTEKLKKTKIATQKAQYQAQISKYKELIEKEKKEATLLEEEYSVSQKKVGDVSKFKAKSIEITSSIESIKDLPVKLFLQALEIDPNYFEALSRLGMYYKEEGENIKKAINNMDMNAYNKEGKALEEKVSAKFSEALPYLERAYKIKKDVEVKEKLVQVYLALKIDKQVD
jgi:tetratricopeptide (TPR) repeat protein